MLNIVMDVENSVLSSLTEELQTLRMKDVPGGNVGTVVSYLKGSLLLLRNCLAIPTDVMGLIQDVMLLVDCDKFTSYMRSIYFASKRESLAGGGYMDYHNRAETEYRTLYRKWKWPKNDTTPDSSFIGGYNASGGDQREGKHCHNCGKVGHLTQTCWGPEGVEARGGIGRGGRNGREI